MAERRVVFVIKGGSSGTVRDWQLFVLSILALVKFFFCLHFFSGRHSLQGGIAIVAQ